MLDDQALSRRKICIVGAGVSGLRAAELLISAGFDVTVLEARDRIGGRVQQSARLGLPIDIGASWIHGTKNNPFVSLAEKARSTTVACGAVDSICDQHGEWLGREAARELYEEVWQILGEAMETSRAQFNSIDDSSRMVDVFKQEVERRYCHIGKSEARRILMLQIVEMWGAFMGDDFENQSLKNFWLDCGIEGGTFIAIPEKSRQY